MEQKTNNGKRPQQQQACGQKRASQQNVRPLLFCQGFNKFPKIFLREVHPLTFIRIQGSKKDINYKYNS